MPLVEKVAVYPARQLTVGVGLLAVHRNDPKVNFPD